MQVTIKYKGHDLGINILSGSPARAPVINPVDSSVEGDPLEFDFEINSGNKLLDEILSEDKFYYEEVNEAVYLALRGSCGD